MIEILNYEAINDGKKIGMVDVKLMNGLVIRRIAHLANEKSKWFNWPSFAVEKDGNKKYTPFVEFQLEMHSGQFFEALSAAVKEYKIKHKIAEPEAINLEDTSLPF